MFRPRFNARGGGISIELVLQLMVLHCSVGPITSYMERILGELKGKYCLLVPFTMEGI
jgi:hypothetical protein